MERDNKGRFVKGNTEGHRFQSGGEASAMGKRGVTKREENRTLADVLRRQLQEKASSGSPMTKLEYLVAKALENHSKGALSLKDLSYLQKLLGEDIVNLNVKGVAPIVAKDEQDAAKIQGMLDSINERKSK